MGFFSDIKDKIFGHEKAQPVRMAEATPPQAPTSQPTSSPAVQTAAPAAPITATPQNAASVSAPAQAPASAQASGASAGGATTAASGSVDVAAILDDAVAKSGQTLDWRKSIVDLMKALGIDSSLSARKELATELNYTGDTNDSATMNMWLHKTVIQKLADNGGKVPADLL